MFALITISIYAIHVRNTKTFINRMIGAFRWSTTITSDHLSFVDYSFSNLLFFGIMLAYF